MAIVTLCLDFGNTRLKAAVFQDDALTETIIMDDGAINTIHNLLQQYQPQKTILSSVIHHDAAIEELLARETKFHRLTHQSRLPFKISVPKPETVGADRLALAAGTVHSYPEKNSLVVGCGTCITYNFINKYNEFLGGAISPGVEMRFRSLKEYTAMLPLVRPSWNAPLIGYDTATNILSGVIIGIAKEIDGFVNAYEERFDNFNGLLTGGDTTLLASHLKTGIFADPELMFKGLYAISEVNNP